MTKKNGKQPAVFDEAFKREAVRILATGGRTVRQVADDLGVGFSTLNKWKSRLEEAELARRRDEGAGASAARE